MVRLFTPQDDRPTGPNRRSHVPAACAPHPRRPCRAVRSTSMSEDLQRHARSFGGVADAYDRGRPTYPDDAVAWLVSE